MKSSQSIHLHSLLCHTPHYLLLFWSNYLIPYPYLMSKPFAPFFPFYHLPNNTKQVTCKTAGCMLPQTGGMTFVCYKLEVTNEKCLNRTERYSTCMCCNPLIDVDHPWIMPLSVDERTAWSERFTCLVAGAPCTHQLELNLRMSLLIYRFCIMIS